MRRKTKTIRSIVPSLWITGRFAGLASCATANRADASAPVLVARNVRRVNLFAFISAFLISNFVSRGLPRGAMVSSCPTANCSS